MAPGPRPTSIISGILVHPAIWPQYTWAENSGAGVAVPFFWGKMGPHLTQRDLAEAYLCTKWHLDPSSRLATTDMGRKLAEGRLCPFFGGGVGSPSNTVLPVPSSTSTPSFILIHPTVWPQYTNVTDSTDNCPIAQDEPFYKRSPKKTVNSIQPKLTVG